ncbi:SDR family NAD(P)-dependent oxidoreductase [Mycolicibacterium sp.]|uniref:SDR family NAD(P)-dependent oxidoreductase n=1 Tax=Mycolicibacterium sp. TaxID=2320850 RepID=UPI001A3322E7|nr:SDR family NAD(P)-dependent oxidoreductase [Mycolicibacterium sp.]MBJ7341445.1 SDR family NAD(P)-dependent oxidoreductase [Mycolicibacterium sp.]
MSSNTKWTAADVPDQSGRVAIVTGSNTGLGYDTARVLAERGAHVVLAVRDLDKGKAAAARLVGRVPRADVTVHRLDVGSLKSVRTAAEELKTAYPRIDLLINNAGVMYPPKQLTEDGFELQFGTNHLGAFALTGLLLENLLPVEGSRVVAVASIAHTIQAAIHFDDLQWERKYNRVAAYGQSKLSNLLFTYELNRRLGGQERSDSGSGLAGKDESTIAVAAHPGISNTELMRHVPGSGLPGFSALAGLVTNSPEMGALATLRAATDPRVRGAQYYGPDGFRELRGHPKLVESSRQSHDQDLQGRLWTVSEELTGVTFPV